MNGGEVPEKSPLCGSLKESVGISVLAALGFIAWGLWVNWEHGMASRIQVALTQGGISFIATLSSAELLRKISEITRSWLWTGVIGWAFINALVFLAHWISGTPEILNTMVPGMLGGVFFCFGYGRRFR